MDSRVKCNIKNFAGRIVSNAIVAGTISEVTGGKFANGAMSAAFRVAFNEVLDREPQSSKNLRIPRKYQDKGLDINEFEDRRFGVHVIRDSREIAVGAHGSPDQMKYSNNRTRNVVQWANKIRGLDSYEDGKTVRLYSCNTGFGSVNFAQALANELNTTVIAPNEYMHFWSKGDWVIAPESYSKEDAWKIWSKGEEGNWKSFNKR